jgi:hypothetical protein
MSGAYVELGRSKRVMHRGLLQISLPVSAAFHRLLAIKDFVTVI